MRVCCLIDCLGLGGAQRQLTGLASILGEAGHAVDLVSYHRKTATAGHFAAGNTRRGVTEHFFEGGSRFGKILGFRRMVRRLRPDAVVAYLPGPASLAELVRLTMPQMRLVVSERSLTRRPVPRREAVRLRMHLLAGRVVCNSRSQADVMGELGLGGRTRFIPNLVDVDRFRPRPTPRAWDGVVRIVTVANYTPNKNAEVVIGGMTGGGFAGRVVHEWWGNPLMPNEGVVPTRLHYENLLNRVRETGLADQLRLREIIRDPVPAYQEADAFCLASHYEGSSNSLGEALASGLPILCSRVSDHPRVIEEGVNGFLFDPCSPEEYRSALGKLLALSHEQRLEMGRRNRRVAEEHFSPGAHLDRWIGVLREVARGGTGGGREVGRC